MAAQRNRLYLSQAMYKRIATLYDNPLETWTSEQHRLVSEMHRKFCRAGVQLEESQRRRLSELDEQLSRLSSQYRDNLLAETNQSTVHLTDKADLEGVPQGLINSALDLAKANGDIGWKPIVSLCIHC